MFVDHFTSGNVPSAFILIEVFQKLIYYCKCGRESNWIKPFLEEGSSRILLWLKSAPAFLHQENAVRKKTGEAQN